MYPLIRLGKEILKHRSSPRLGMGETHATHLICWPWDIDIFLEMNNGRALTLYDLGRIVLFQRMGIARIMRRERWGGTIAGASVRYRRRVRAFDRIEMRSRVIGWDDRFTYAEQSMWRDGECASHILLRMATTDRNGIVPTARIEEALGGQVERPDLPDWTRAWIEAEGRRPWPPMRDADTASESATV